MEQSGELSDYVHGEDEIAEPKPVFLVENGEIIEEFTEEYGWPNVTHTGKIMYVNTSFKTRRAAAAHGKQEAEIAIGWLNEDLEKLEISRKKRVRLRNTHAGYLNNFQRILDESS